MKKVLLTLAVVAFLTAISTSCVKSCYCSFDGEPEVYAGELTSAQCQAYETTASISGQTVVCDAR